MREFLIEGEPLRLPSGARIGLRPDQILDRQRNITVLSDHGAFLLCEVGVDAVFKIGDSVFADPGTFPHHREVEG